MFTLGRITRILLIFFIAVLILNLGLRGIRDARQERNHAASVDRLFQSIRDGDPLSTWEAWVSVRPDMREDPELLRNLSREITSAFFIYLSEPERIGYRATTANFTHLVNQMELNSFLDHQYRNYLDEINDFNLFLGILDRVELFLPNQEFTVYYRLKAIQVHQGRKEYAAGIAAFEAGNFETAALHFRNVSAEDLLYFPIAQTKIEECIRLLHLRLSEDRLAE